MQLTPSLALLGLLACSAFVAPAAAGNGAGEPAPQDRILWDARAAEHLLNRAGFGARQRDVDLWGARSQEELVDHLLSRALDVDVDPYFVEIYQADPEYMKGLDKKGMDEVRARLRREERQQIEGYGAWWVDRMLAGLDGDPLRERMTLFWHGHFTTSASTVRRTYEVLRQHQLLRENALGSYAELLHAIVRDPAMIYYLDNNQNRKGRPNENLARELMELFSLGEGNYTERDVKEAARALTGYTADRQGNFVFQRSNHDKGEKTILGITGRFTGKELVDLILAQPACAEHVSRKLIAYFEGVEPSEERVGRYAALFRANDYELEPLLRALFLDPDFYRDQVVGTRVQGPIDYLVGTCVRLNLQRVPSRHVVNAAGLLGQRIFQPPNVKGWEGGMAWITTSTFMQRGNFAGVLLGVVDPKSLIQPDDPALLAAAMEASAGGGEMEGEAVMQGEEKDPAERMTDSVMSDRATDRATDRASDRAPARKAPRVPAELRTLAGIRSGWEPALHFTERLRRAGVETDGEIVDAMIKELLGVGVTESTRRRLIELLAAEREHVAAPEGRRFREGMDMELVLRRLAHQILSLPEAQLS